METFVILYDSSNVSLFTHPWNHCCGKQNLLPKKQKHFMFPYASHLCFLVFAHSWKHDETLAGNNVSATIFPSLPRALRVLRIGQV